MKILSKLGQTSQTNPCVNSGMPATCDSFRGFAKTVSPPEVRKRGGRVLKNYLVH